MNAVLAAWRLPKLAAVALGVEYPLAALQGARNGMREEGAAVSLYPSRLNNCTASWSLGQFHVGGAVAGQVDGRLAFAHVLVGTIINVVSDKRA